MGKLIEHRVVGINLSQIAVVGRPVITDCVSQLTDTVYGLTMACAQSIRYFFRTRKVCGV